ncbi:unnamed protein product [Candidula unifasciata]|uniref:Major facilitator superfamily (MFS) profile domain-containing protein n=1 Tax=Candidula unifasciata TaxID=100452 RepID=A0A8S3ZIL4_9EUPU|nr:unnamed protein product [Candidula unifasciata]
MPGPSNSASMTGNREIGHVDAALEKLGPFRRYTLVQFSINILSQLAVATHMLSIVFTGQKNPFRCPGLRNNYSASFTNNNVSVYDSLCYSLHSTEGNGTVVFNTWECTSQDVEYELPKNHYFVSEFDLVCEREVLAGLTQTLLTLGHAVGSLVFPYFADNYGRKPIILICSILWLASSIALAFSVSYTMLAICKTLVGVFLQGVAQTSVTVMMEILTSGQRGHMFGSLAFIFWTTSIILMIPVAYLLKDYSWRVLELAYCSYFIYIFLLLLLDEPLRWLAANGLTERVMDVLKRAAKWNGSNLDDVLSAFYTVFCIVFFNSLTYYALLLMSSTLSGSLYLNYFLNCVVEIPSAILIYFFIDRWGRKICFAAYSIIAGTTLVAAAVVTTLFVDQMVVIKVLTIMGKFGISGSFGVIYTFTPELFPTNVRNTGLGLANVSACIGGMLAPFSGLLMNQATYAPGVIFGIGSLILSAWTYFLPETARRQLPQSIADIEVWSQEEEQQKNQTCRDPV